MTELPPQPTDRSDLDRQGPLRPVAAGAALPIAVPLPPDLEVPGLLQEQRVRERDRALHRVSVMGQVTTLLAVASTGVIAGVMARDASAPATAAAGAASAASTEQAPAAAARAAHPPVAARPTVVRKPVRTVVVRVPASQQSRSSTTSRQQSVSRSAPRAAAAQPRAQAPRPAPPVAVQAPPKAAPPPAATKSTGS